MQIFARGKPNRKILPNVTIVVLKPHILSIMSMLEIILLLMPDRKNVKVLKNIYVPHFVNSLVVIK